MPLKVGFQRERSQGSEVAGMSWHTLYPSKIGESQFPARLILHFISDHYTDGIWTPESKDGKARATFFQEFAN